jgi:pyruvate kinase
MDTTRRTKIVATLGPATDDPVIMAAMVQAGLDVARVNFSHGTRDAHRKRISMLRAVAKEADRYVGILADLSGPKIRIESFRDGSVNLVEGAPFALDTALDPQGGTATEVGCAYLGLPGDVRGGDALLLNDGQIILGVDKVLGTRILCTVRVGGELSNRKGVNRQGGGISAPALTEKDLEDIRVAAELGLDYVAVSFCRDSEDIRRAQSEVRKWRSDAKVIAKIERHEALDNLSAILQVTDAVMVARGDLGVEMGYAELTGLQKTIIRQSLARNRVVITATQMMESMINNPMPTRAEVSDVANAVLDGTDAVMLSAETATGKYPVKAVQAMAEVIKGAEKYQIGAFRPRQARQEDEFVNTEEAISHAVNYTASRLRVRAIVALTESGLTPLLMSRSRTDIPIYAFTRHAATRNRVTLYRGVYAVPFDINYEDAPRLYPAIFDRLLDLGLVDTGDQVLLTKGELSGVSGGTNSMQILHVTRRDGS